MHALTGTCPSGWAHSTSEAAQAVSRALKIAVLCKELRTFALQDACMRKP